MVRPLRIEYPGAVCHVTSWGDRREPIAKDDTDRAPFLDIMGHSDICFGFSRAVVAIDNTEVKR